ncbi:MAG: hypothetical protein Salg2KO_20020 [Salibacteraceae bacterium]
MKIRIKDNSLRLRLTQSEVAAFEHDGSVSAAIKFPNGHSLIYSLNKNDGDEFVAEFNGTQMLVSVPESAYAQWLKPTEVGMEDRLKLEDGESLRVLIEKDFACLTERVDEDESDNFPNPNVNC